MWGRNVHFGGARPVSREMIPVAGDPGHIQLSYAALTRLAEASTYREPVAAHWFRLRLTTACPKALRRRRQSSEAATQHIGRRRTPRGEFLPQVGRGQASFTARM